MIDLIRNVTVASFISLWLTHITVCLMKGKLLLLIAGAVIFPAGIFHGALVLLGKV